MVQDCPDCKSQSQTRSDTLPDALERIRIKHANIVYTLPLIPTREKQPQAVKGDCQNDVALQPHVCFAYGAGSGGSKVICM